MTGIQPRKGALATTFVHAASFLVLAAFFLAFAASPAFAWRSALYPTNWNPGYTDGMGRFLHDFSYAGYRNSEEPIPSIAGPVANVVTQYGADDTGTTDTTPLVQLAIDDAATSGGAVVYFPPGLYKFDGKLTVQANGTILRGAGPTQSRLWFTQAVGVDYDAHIRFTGDVQWGADVPLATDGANRSFAVEVADASSLSVGDEVAVGWVITPQFVAEHLMTGTWTQFNGQWRPFFRRKILSIDASGATHVVRFEAPLRYPAKTRDAASIRPVNVSGGFDYLKDCAIEDLAIANAVDPAVANSLNQVQAIRFLRSEDCWARNVHSFASPDPLAAGDHLQSGGINVEASNRVTVANCRMEHAQNQGSGGNGYLFEVRHSNEVLFKDNYADDGRHNYIQNWDFGTTGCVWLRCRSVNSFAGSEYHHSLSMACLVDSCDIDDDWEGANRQGQSSGAGHTATQCAYWNTTGDGSVGSWCWEWGYVIGTGPQIGVSVGTSFLGKSLNTEPFDYVEGLNQAATLAPQSLFEDQLARRLANGVRVWADYD